MTRDINGKVEPESRMVTMIQVGPGFKVYSQTSPSATQENIYQNRMTHTKAKFALEERSFPGNWQPIREYQRFGEDNSDAFYMDQLRTNARIKGKLYANNKQARYIEKAK